MLKKAIGTIQVRSVSSKYPRPTPRPYRRRVFEAAVAPELPKMTTACVPPGLFKVEKDKASKEFMDVEIALANMVKTWLKQEDFRVLAVCQFNPVAGRTLWLAKNQLRLKNIEFRNYGNKIMKKVFENTPISSLDVAFVGSNAILLGKDLTTIKDIVQETKKYTWIQPLVMMLDSRIISMEEATKLAELSSLEDLRAQTVQILGQQTAEATISLDHVTRQLSNTLDFHVHENQKE